MSNPNGIHKDVVPINPFEIRLALSLLRLGELDNAFDVTVSTSNIVCIYSHISNLRKTIKFISLSPYQS